ncbi:MAG: hypothetical protein NC483_03445 [Ruminococcus sp.]|nr:hypothetical protein [Ruminococcus sp.]
MIDRTFLIELFDNIKDDIDCDSDIEAIYKILISIFKENKENAISSWQYILSNYDITRLKQDIDFTPILKDFPSEILYTLTLQEFYKILDNTKYKNLIYENLFNVFDKESAIYILIYNLIANKKMKKERETIQIVIENIDKYSSLTFDLSTFLKNIILFHLKQSEKNIDLLWEYTNIPSSNKEKSILKTLLIDYL